MELEARAEEISRFLARYSLSEAEADALLHAPLDGQPCEARPTPPASNGNGNGGGDNGGGGGGGSSDEDGGDGGGDGGGAVGNDGNDGEDDEGGGNGGGGGFSSTNAGVFFAALDRLRRVRRACVRLAGAPSGRGPSASSQAFELLEAKKKNTIHSRTPPVFFFFFVPPSLHHLGCGLRR